MAAAAPFVPGAGLHTCDGVALFSDAPAHLGELLQRTCARHGFQCFEATNFVMGLMRPLGVPLLAPDGRELSGRGYSFRIPHGPWVLWLVERLFGNTLGDVGAGDWLGNHTEGVWVAQPVPSALEVDYSEGGAYSAACAALQRRPGVRCPKLQYEAFAPGRLCFPAALWTWRRQYSC